MGYKRCLQSLLLLFDRQFIDGVRGLQTMSSKSVVTFHKIFIDEVHGCPQSLLLLFLQTIYRWGPWVSSKSVVTFLTNNLSMRSMGVLKVCCYFSYKQFIDEVHGSAMLAASQCFQSNFSAERLMRRLTSRIYGWGPWVSSKSVVTFLTNNLSMRSMGVLKVCCYFSYKQFIDEVHGLQTVSSKSVTAFLTDNLSMRSMGYKRCPQSLLLLFNKQFIDGARWLQTMSSKSVATFDKQFIDGVHGLQTVSSKVCCYFSYKQLIDGVHGLQKMSSKSVATFWQTIYRSVGYKRCPQKML